MTLQGHGEIWGREHKIGPRGQGKQCWVNMSICLGGARQKKLLWPMTLTMTLQGHGEKWVQKHEVGPRGQWRQCWVNMSKYMGGYPTKENVLTHNLDHDPSRSRRNIRLKTRSWSQRTMKAMLSSHQHVSGWRPTKETYWTMTLTMTRCSSSLVKFSLCVPFRLLRKSLAMGCRAISGFCFFSYNVKFYFYKSLNVKFQNTNKYPVWVLS